MRQPFFALAMILLLMVLPAASGIEPEVHSAASEPEPRPQGSNGQPADITGNVLGTSAPAPTVPLKGSDGSRGPAYPDFDWSIDIRLTYNDKADLFPEFASNRSSDNLVTWYRDGQQYIEWLDPAGGVLTPEKAILNASPPVQQTGQLTQRMALDGSSNINLVWTDDGFYDPACARFLPNGTLVTPYSNISAYSERAHVPYIALKAQNQVYMAYESVQNDSVGMASFGNGTLQTIWDHLVDDSVGLVLRVDGNSSANLLTRYHESGKGLHYTRYSKDMDLICGADIETPVDGSGLEAPMPAMAFGPDGSMHLLQASRLSGVRTLYYTNYDNLGKTLTDHIALTFTAGDFGDIAVDGRGSVYVVWGDAVDGELYFATLHPGDGYPPEPAVKLTKAVGASRDPHISIDPGGVPSVAWVDERDGNPEIYFKVGAIPKLELSMTPEDTYKLQDIPTGTSRSANVTARNPGRMNETVSLDISHRFPRPSWLDRRAGGPPAPARSRRNRKVQPKGHYTIHRSARRTPRHQYHRIHF